MVVAKDGAKDGPAIIDEMSIVDVFTKLIFDADSNLDATEDLVVELLRQIDGSLVGDSRRDVSEYLRSMGVDEMIKVVGKVKRQINQQNMLVNPGSGHGHSLHH